MFCQKEVSDQRVSLHKVPAQDNGILLCAASLGTLFSNVVDLQQSLDQIWTQSAFKKPMSTEPGGAKGLTVFFWVSVAVMPSLLPCRNEWDMSLSSIVLTLHSTR